MSADADRLLGLGLNVAANNIQPRSLSFFLTLWQFLVQERKKIKTDMEIDMVKWHEALLNRASSGMKMLTGIWGS